MAERTLGAAKKQRPSLPARGWRARLEMAKLWQAADNWRGDDVTLVHLPKAGIKGNTHIPL